MVEIRMIEREEYRAAKRVAARAFSPLHYFFISMSPDTLIAVEDGEILGGIVMKKSRISRAWSVGVIDWVFVHPDQQGRGIGQQLADAGIQLLREKGCEEIYAIVEGYNTSSQKLWSNRGFSVLSPFEQLRRFGLRFLMVW
ncbi:MAG: GNAT family N-acetyltransferase, partial [Anaerolineaceae bacterium]|nr:GNAT family N-acetyltransferase [Anaerolineaceae bacterium]